MKTLSLVIAGVLGSGISVAEAQDTKRRLPDCPQVTTRYSNDIAGVLSPEKAMGLEAFLKQVDTLHHNQLVFYSVESPEKYGFSTIEEMANALGRECKVGHAGVNSGVVLLVSKDPRRYRIETANIQTQLTDALSRLILENSKVECRAEDFSCRVPYIAQEIEKVIALSLKQDGTSVEKLRELTTQYQRDQSADTFSKILLILGLSILVIITVFGFMVILRRDKQWLKEQDDDLKKVLEGKARGLEEQDAQERKKRYDTERQRLANIRETRTTTANIVSSTDEDARRKRREEEQKRQRDEDDRRRKRDDEDRRRRSSDDDTTHRSILSHSTPTRSDTDTGGGYSGGGGGGFDGGGGSSD